MRKILSVRFAPALLTACALATAGAAFAADPTTDGDAATTRAAKRAEFQQRFFDKLDTNHDGIVSRAEYQAWVDGRFAKLDVNGDGSVDANEIAASPATAERVQKRAEGFVKRYDTSGDGQVTKTAYEAKEMARFDRISGGADSLTPDELSAAAHSAFQHRHARAGNATPAPASE